MKLTRLRKPSTCSILILEDQSTPKVFHSVIVELKAAMTSLGFEAKNQTIFQMIADMDADGSGELEFAEFFHLMTAKTDSGMSKDNVRKLFNLFDDDHTDSIHLDNLRRVAKELAEEIDDEEINEMIRRADDNGDMSVSFDEFYHIVINKRFCRVR